MLLKPVLIIVFSAVLLPILNMVFRLMSEEENRHKQHPGKCRQIVRMGIGSEDIHITTSGLAFVTSGFCFQIGSKDFVAVAKSKGWGRIQLLDMNAPFPSLEAEELMIRHGADFNRAAFRPHGLSVLEDAHKGEHLLYVVNHRENDTDSVEKFRYLPKVKELEHVKSFYSDLFRITNDLALVDEDRFYISNYLHFVNPMLAALEQMFEFSLGSVVFHNGKDTTEAIVGLVSPNGLTLSTDRRYLYMAILHSKTVRVYERHSDLDIRQVQEVEIHTLPDNFHLSDDGHSLYVGTHPNVRKLLRHSSNPEHKAPSLILRMPLQDGLIVEKEITQEFYDDGDLISASSIAGVFKDKMVVGSVLDSLVVCQLPTT